MSHEKKEQMMNNLGKLRQEMNHNKTDAKRISKDLQFAEKKLKQLMWATDTPWIPVKAKHPKTGEKRIIGYYAFYMKEEKITQGLDQAMFKMFVDIHENNKQGKSISPDQMYQRYLELQKRCRSIFQSADWKFFDPTEAMPRHTMADLKKLASEAVKQS